jgi:AcrR family transcriptional regulator
MEASKRIADKACALFRQYGIRSTGMDTIAGSLGMSKKTIYRFYQSKDRLVTVFVAHELHANAGKCQHRCKKAADAIVELFMVMISIRELFAQLNLAMVLELEEHYTDAYGLWNRYQSVFLSDIIDRNLARGVNEQLYREDINRKLLGRLMLENFRLTTGNDFLKEGTIEQWFVYLIGGIVSSKGFATIEIYKNESEIRRLTGYPKHPFWND